MWSDTETTTDLLGYTVHANLLKQVIMSEQNLPVTIGLYGDWGSGKSSILKILEDRIQNDADSKDDSIVIYFDGWSFESFDDAKMALIQGIVDKLEENEKLTENIKSKVKEAAKTVKDKIFSMRTLMWSMKNLIIPAGAAYLTGGASIIPSVMSIFKSFDKDKLAEILTSDKAESFLEEALNTNIKENQFSAVREFREAFEKLIDATGKKRVVILIDDLDRCLPEHIIENLEAIKLFLNVKNTAFVIAADQNIVSGAIRRQYKDMIDLNEGQESSRGIGQEYMDKFIQIPYSIPKLSDQEIETYVTLLFCQSMLEKETFDVIYNDYQSFILANKFETYGWANIKALQGIKESEDLENIVTFIVRCTSSISKNLHRNPRLIKRFLNAFELRTQLLKQSGNLDDTNRFVLLKLMLLEMSHPKLFRQLSEWTMNEKGHPNEIRDLEKAASEDDSFEKYPEWNDKVVKDLLNIDPKFSSVDLREIYWVSRDKLVDGMGGITLISAKLKKLFAEIYSKANLSDTTVENKCRNDVKNLNDNELDNFYDLLNDKLFSDPEQTQSYVIYYYMIKVGVKGAYEKFLESFARVVEKAPLSIGGLLKQLLSSRGNDPKLNDLIEKNKKLKRFVHRKDDGNLEKNR